MLMEIGLDTILDICKKTMGYRLEKVVVNDDGTTTHLHSDKFLDDHPERVDSPEFTKDEERAQVEMIASLARMF